MAGNAIKSDFWLFKLVGRVNFVDKKVNYFSEMERNANQKLFFKVFIKLHIYLNWRAIFIACHASV